MADQRLDTTNLAAVLATNPGLAVTQAGLSGIIAGTIRAHGGCIKVLRYGDSSKDLDYVLFDSGDSLSSGVATNLNDFAQVLLEAANHGHRVTYCQDTAGRRIFMVNLWPCGCTCRDGKNLTAS